MNPKTSVDCVENLISNELQLASKMNGSWKLPPPRMRKAGVGRAYLPDIERFTKRKRISTPDVGQGCPTYALRHFVPPLNLISGNWKGTEGAEKNPGFQWGETNSAFRGGNGESHVVALNGPHRFFPLLFRPESPCTTMGFMHGLPRPTAKKPALEQIDPYNYRHCSGCALWQSIRPSGLPRACGPRNDECNVSCAFVC
jgi:hypothetical protein